MKRRAAGPQAKRYSPPRMLVCVLLAAGLSRAQEGTNTFEQLTVTARPISAGNVQGLPDSVASLLVWQPGVLVKPQGNHAVQNDLSIRGSSFSGAGLSVAGLALDNPQTEHFLSELPLPPSILGPPRLLTGVDQARATEGHLVGTIAFDFPTMTPERLVAAGVGENDRHWEQVLVRLPGVLPSGYGQVGLSAFGLIEQANGIDYADNDLQVYPGQKPAGRQAALALSMVW